MCGIFGFLANDGRGPELDRLKRIALVTESRGPHAFGLAWLTRDGELKTFKRPGPASDGLADLDQVRGAVAVIGHCRWATHGSPDDNANNHPHRAGSGWLVHNGVVFNHRRIVEHYGLATRTQCDSEVLGLLLARVPGPLDRRAACVAQVADGPLAMLGLWSGPTRLVVARQGKPLAFGANVRGTYFASLTDELPGMPRSVADGYVGLLSPRKGRVVERARILV